MIVYQAIELLGQTVRDRVTGVKGVVTSISFDLYGCIQAIVTGPAKPDGEFVQGRWYDTNRLQILSTERVMALPDFAVADPPGPAGKPSK